MKTLVSSQITLADFFPSSAAIRSCWGMISYQRYQLNFCLGYF